MGRLLGAWIILWSLLALAVLVAVIAIGIWSARAFDGRRRPAHRKAPPAEPPNLQQQRDARRRRPAHCQISRKHFPARKDEEEEEED